MRIVKHVRRMKPSARTLLRVFTVYARFAQSVWRGAWSKAKVPRAGAQCAGSTLGCVSGMRIAKRMAATRNAGAERSWGEALRIVVGRVEQTNPARLFLPPSPIGVGECCLFVRSVQYYLRSCKNAVRSGALDLVKRAIGAGRSLDSKRTSTG